MGFPRTALALAAVAAGAGALAFGARSRSTAASEPDPVARELRELETRKPVSPARNPRAEAARSDAAARGRADLPALTARLDTWTADAPDARTTRIVTRSPERISIEIVGARKEWLFRRNPVEPSHSSASLVDHASGAILGWSNSDLVHEGLAASWETRSCLGVELAELAGLEDTGERRTAFGTEFGRLVPPRAEGDAPRADGDGLREVWWNGALGVALRAERTRALRSVVTELTDLRLEADPELLREPAERLPGYESKDVGDHRESHRHHEGG